MADTPPPHDPVSPPPDPADPVALAEAFIDLWQDQLSAMAGDAELPQIVARLWGLWTPPPAAEAADSPHADGSTRDTVEPPAPGPAPAAAASRLGRHDVGQLLARVGELEQRIAQLEAGPRTPRRRVERSRRRTRA